MKPITFKRNNFNSTFAQEAKNKHNLTQEEILLGIPTLSNITSDSINSPEGYAWEALQQLLLTSKQLYLDIHIYNVGASCSILYQYPFGIRIRSFINNNDKILSNTAPLLNASIASNFGMDFYSEGEVNPEWTEITNVIDNRTILRNEGIISVGGIVGKIEHMPFRIADLPFGWYACDGSLYPIESKEGIALSDLPANYKLDWKIDRIENNINIPMLTEGKSWNNGGAFFRSVPDGQQGREQDDQLQAHQHIGYGPSPSYPTANGSHHLVAGQQKTILYSQDPNFTEAGDPRIGNETIPHNKGMLPCIYLGV